MKFQTKELSAALSQLSGAVPRNSSMPILGHILIQGRGDHARLTGSDTQQQVEVDVPADGAKDLLTINYARLVAAAKQTDADTITLGTMGAGGQISVTAGKSRYRLSAFPPADWPAWPEHPRQTVAINAAAMSGMLAHCAPAAAVNDARPYLNGVHLDHDGGTLHAVATDGHRIHVASLPLTTTARLTSIIPIDAVSSARACLSDMASDIQFGAGEYDCELAGVWGNWRAKTLEGRYPDWRRMVPKTEFACTVAQKDLAAVLARVLGLKKGKYMGARLAFCDQALMVTGTNSEQETIEDEINATCDGTYTVTVNAEYMLDAISGMKNLNVIIRFAANDSIPLFVEPEDSGLAYSQYAVVMPIKV